MRRRFELLRKLVLEHLNDPILRANAADFEFTRDPAKVSQFLRWLQRQSRLIVLGGPPQSNTNKSWQSMYIDSAYQRGLARAAAQLRGRGVKVDDSYVDSAFFRPQHADRVGLIYTRAYTELEGITAAVDQKLSRILATGVGEGRGVQSIARDISSTIRSIGETRARTLARTEVIGTHAAASLNTYRDAGVEGVSADVEFATAQDNAVCPECEGLSKQDNGMGPGIFTLEEADGIIPVHPNCRCAWLPVVGDVRRARELI